MSEVIYYFNAYASGVEEWTTNPARMVNGVDTHYAETTIDGDIQKLTGNTCPGSDWGTITKVELRFYGYNDTNDETILRPIFSGGDGNNHVVVPGTTPGWKAYQDITSDTNAPDWSSWSHIVDLECDVEKNNVSKGNTNFVGEVEIRVTYTIPPWDPPVSDIDVGADPLSRATAAVKDWTSVDKNNAANASGILHTIQVNVRIDLTGLRVGTFYVVSGDILKCRDSVLIGDVTAGFREFTGLSLTVQTGDYIGSFFTDGQIWRDLTGYAGIWQFYGESIDPNDEATYTFRDGDAISLYGYGDIVGAVWKQLQYTSEPPTPNAWNQLKHTADAGWNQINYEGE